MYRQLCCRTTTAHTHTHTHMHARAHTHTHTHKLSLSLSRMRAHTHTYTHTAHSTQNRKTKRTQLRTEEVEYFVFMKLNYVWQAVLGVEHKCFYGIITTGLNWKYKRKERDVENQAPRSIMWVFQCISAFPDVWVLGLACVSIHKPVLLDLTLMGWLKCCWIEWNWTVGSTLVLLWDAGW